MLTKTTFAIHHRIQLPIRIDLVARFTKVVDVVTVTVDCCVFDTILSSPLWRMVMLSWVRSVKTRPKFLAAETSAFSSGD